MIIKPLIRGFICTAAHPAGCAEQVREQIRYVRAHAPLDGPKKVLIIGASTGYGLASRIVASFGAGADTLGVFFERPAADKRTASAGWYNTAAFEREADESGRIALSVNGDAFSDEIKAQTIDIIRKRFGGKVDLVIYSLASPRRIHPKTGDVYSSVLKPIGQTFVSKTVNPMTGAVSDVTIEPATADEVAQTVAVMGGEDWMMWMDALADADVLARGAITVAYSYIGAHLTSSIYRKGTIGKAKEDLERTVAALNEKLKDIGGKALISVNKALVTQASAAIPVVPLYISLLYKVMKAKQLHEGCIEQIYRLFSQALYPAQKGNSGAGPVLDSKNRLRLDDLEMRPDVQQAVEELWSQAVTENLEAISDIAGYRDDFAKLFGFNSKTIDYDSDADPDVLIPSLTQDPQGDVSQPVFR